MLQKLRHLIDCHFRPGIIARMRERDALRELDDRMLADIGISRDETRLGRPIRRHACPAMTECDLCAAQCIDQMRTRA
jgi:uncharacterized protein YjiS (DUF1127 family)